MSHRLRTIWRILMSDRPHEHEHHNEHEHEHHHEHGEHCSCGHEHEHEHHHEHGHKHHHEHENSAPAPEPETKSAKRTYLIENLDCANCAAKMEKRINELPEVEFASITYATKQLRIAAENPDALLPRILEICTSIESEVTITPLKTRPARGSFQQTEAEKKEERKDLICIAAGLLFFLLGFLLKKPLPWLSVASFVLAYLALGMKIVWTAVKNLFKGNIFDENFLMSIATLGAFAIAQYDEAVGVMLFYRIGEWFEHRAVSKSRSQIMEALDLRPESVNVLRGAETVSLPAEEACIGDILLVRPGDRIPLDGTVVDGESRIDTSPVTGEPVPVKVIPGSAVLSGCMNTSGLLKIRVDKVLGESMVTRILDSVENAAASKPKIDRFITRFARIYTPVVVLLALGTAVIPSLITGDWKEWIYTALTFLVISCPCALVLSVPLAFFSGIGTGSRQGILFKGGASIEALKNVRAVAMDKTGTLTKGNFILQQIAVSRLCGDLLSHADHPETALLSLAASCENASTHPIADSILQAARERGISWEIPASVEEISGHGIHAVLSSGAVLCGNAALLADHGVDLSEYKQSAYGTEVLLALNNVFMGSLVIADTVKEDVPAAMARLKNMRITTAMLTGDSRQSAAAIAGSIGISEVHAQLLPQEKLNELQNIRQKHGPVMFVGDGINDAPVLANADVGAAMGSGADAAIEAADIVFLTSDTQAIPESIRIARQTGQIASQNVIFALVIKAAVMILGLAGFASMWFAVFADSGVAMLCVLNSIRILYRKKK